MLSNSAHVGGQREDLRYLVNHQSCEATADRERHELIAAAGQVAYHHRVCGELGVNRDETAVLGTAANMTEAKSAALADLAVPSRCSPTIATGTGTDQFCLATPLDAARRPKESTSPHVKLGEIIGVAVKESIEEALRWQNGLEVSCTRGLFHALGRFGLTEARAMERLADLLPASRYELLDKNRKAVFFEPGVGAAAYALAAVLDRVTCGTIPEGLAHEALRCQAACVACALAGRPDKWLAFRTELMEASGDPIELVLRAVAAGWQAKWA